MSKVDSNNAVVIRHTSFVVRNAAKGPLCSTGMVVPLFLGADFWEFFLVIFEAGCWTVCFLTRGLTFGFGG